MSRSRGLEKSKRVPSIIWMALYIVPFFDFVKIAFYFFQLQEDESILKTLMSAKSLYEQGYDEKVYKICCKIQNL